jgi:hypothetical protein
MRTPGMTGSFVCTVGRCGARPAAPREEDEYIELARELQAFKDHPKAALLPNPMVAHPEPSATEEPVEEAELLENLGEFPGRTDQGDRMPAPMTKRRAREYLRSG